MYRPRLYSPALPILLGAALILGCDGTRQDPVRPLNRGATLLVSKSFGCLPPDTLGDPNPDMTITDPRSINVLSIVPTDFTVHWSGTDAEGRIREYRFKLFSTSNPDFPDISDFVAEVLSKPSLLEHFYGPCFDTWERVPGSKTSHTFHGLLPGQRYLFAITAVDDNGRHTPRFTNTINTPERQNYGNVWAVVVAAP